MNNSEEVTSLLYQRETRNGTISIDKAVVGKIISDAISKFHGKVVISNHKGKVSGFAAKIGVTDDWSSMEIISKENGLDIRFFILIRFGTSINHTTDTLIKTIKENVEMMTDMNVNSIAVVVTGMVSKQTARRNIVVKG